MAGVRPGVRGPQAPDHETGLLHRVVLPGRGDRPRRRTPPLCGVSPGTLPRLLQRLGTVHPGDGTSASPTVAAIDDQRHTERIASDRSKRSHTAVLDELPDGVIVTLSSGEDRAYLVRGGYLLAWSPRGYRERRRRPKGAEANVLTPPSTVWAIKAGYVPAIHTSAVALT